MRVLITGGTGFIGKALAFRLLELGHELVILTRSPGTIESRFPFPAKVHRWNPMKELPPKEAFEGVDVLINLLGEPIAAKRWSPKQVDVIKNSRVISTQNLMTAMEELGVTPKTCLMASAIGFYGDHGDEEITETRGNSSDLLGKICGQWEMASEAVDSKSRRVLLRIGLVLGHGGGLLSDLKPVFENGLGAPLGKGHQWMSWIHVDDVVGIIIHCMNNENIKGPVNVTAPQPVRNIDFSKILSTKVQRWMAPPVPSFLLKIVKGGIAEFAMASQKVIPKVAQETGYEFKYKSLEPALSELIGDGRGEQVFVSQQWLPKKINDVFPFFSDAKNLERITPPWLNFKVKNLSSEGIEKGTLIDYELKIHGVPVKWQSKIEDWNPTESFSDTQVKGPYDKWFHTHRFHELAGGTLMEDVVIYRLPVGILGNVFGGKFVEKDVKKIFNYRKTKVREIFNF